MTLFSSKKRKPLPKKSAASKGRGKREDASILSLWIETITFLVFAFLVYVLASVFSLKTGAWGEAVRFSLLRNWGGAVVIPVLFAGYLCVAYFLKTGAKGLLSQALGTILLFLCTSLLFGLFRTAGIFQSVPIFFPGYLGQGLAVFFTRELGVLGTTLLAVATLILSATLYGFIHPASIIARISRVFRSFSLPRFRTSIPREEEEHLEKEDEKETPPTRFVFTRPPALPTSPEPIEATEEESSLPDEQEDPEAFSFFGSGNDEISDDSRLTENEQPSPEASVRFEESANDFFTEDTVKPEEEISGGTYREKRKISFGDEDLFVLKQPGEYEEEPALEEPEEAFRPSSLLAEADEPEQDIARDPSALPDIDFNVVEPERHVRGGTFPPPSEIFGPRQELETTENNETVQEQAVSIISTLADFGVSAEMADVVIGPTVIQFQLQLAPGIKVSKVAGLSNDLAVALTVPSLRVEAPIPGKPYVGVEIPNPKRKGIALRTILESRTFQEAENDLPLAMGVRVDSRPLVIGLEDLPHLLVAGTTGSGKSVFVTSCITGLCTHRTPDELRLILVDPKRVELSIYENLPHVLAKPVVSPKKAVQALAWAVREMERRYEVFARARVRNLKSYNQNVLPKAKLPYIVIVVDELADLMFTAQKDVEDYICRLAQMARATGIHLILATQRPSVNVITGLIKANIPARVAFTLPSQTDSRTIIDVSGAERLLGKGDMLFVSSKYPRPLRLQAPFIDDAKSIAIVEYLANVFGAPEYVDIEAQGGESSNNGDTSFADDPLLEEAVDIVMETGIASASRLQRQLRVGFTRAARLVDTMEQIGIVGPPEGSKPREILVDDESARSLLSRVLTGDSE
jgi:S-DNA-T family DNA segregation ATPase FtsK/SpoIIIE